MVKVTVEEMQRDLLHYLRQVEGGGNLGDCEIG